MSKKRKLALGIIAVCALTCAAAALWFLTKPAAEPPAPDSPHSLYMNSVKPDPVPLLEKPNTEIPDRKSVV